MNKTFIATLIIITSCTTAESSNKSQHIENQTSDTVQKTSATPIISSTTISDSLITWEYLKFQTEAKWSDEHGADFQFPIWEDKHYYIENKEMFFIGKLVSFGNEFTLYNPDVKYAEYGVEEYNYIDVIFDSLNFNLPKHTEYAVKLKGKIELNSSDPMRFKYILKETEIISITEINSSESIELLKLLQEK